MPSARDHPFNQSRRPLLECRPGPMNSDFRGVDADDCEDEDYADYEDIYNNNNNNNKNSRAREAPTTTTSPYGFPRNFTKAPTIDKSNARNIYNGFHDFNAIPRVNGIDGYPYGEKLISEQQPIGRGVRDPKDSDFKFSSGNSSNNGCNSSSNSSSSNQTYLNNNNQQQQQQVLVQSQQHGPLLSRKLNNQHVNVFNNNNHFNQPKIENGTEPDFSNRPLPQTPTSPMLLARQRPVPRAVCPTPPLCRANRKGPFIFGVDSAANGSNSTSNSSIQSPHGSPLLRPGGVASTQPKSPVIDQWKYSTNNNSTAVAVDSVTGSAPATILRRRDVFQPTNAVQPMPLGGKEAHHDTIWDRKKEIWDEAQLKSTISKKNTTKGGSHSSTPVTMKKESQVTRRKKRDGQTVAGTAAGTISATEQQRQRGVPSVKCVVVGDAAVGKTNLIISYLENRFLQEHIPTASDIYNGEVEVDGSPVHVTLCDTAGQDTSNASALRELCYPGSDVFLVCFSVVNPETFRSVQTNWIPKLTKQHRHASVILVGTRSDLRKDQSTIAYLQMQGEKPVSVTDAWDYARSIGAKYVESSSRTKEKVKDAFDTAIWDALLSQQQSIKKPFWRRLFCLA